GKGLDDDLGAVQASTAGRSHAPAPGIEGGMNQSQHLRTIGVHDNDMWFVGGPVQRRDTNVVVCAGLELPGAGFQVGSCLLVLAVHPDRSEPSKILVVGLAKAKGDGCQWANDVLFA